MCQNSLIYKSKNKYKKSPSQVARVEIFMVDVDNLINFGALQLVNFVVNCDQLIQICSAPVLPACNSCNLCQHLFVNVYLYILISPPRSEERRVGKAGRSPRALQPWTE